MDVVVIGGGPGGYAAAIRCAQRGVAVTLVEERDIGGTCLNRGCIPTKAMVESARAYREAGVLAEFGVRAGPAQLDFPTVLVRRERLVAGLTAGVGQLLQAAGVRVLRGRGRLAGGVAVDVAGPDAGRLQPDAVILASGSEPAALAVPGAGLPGVVDSDGLLARRDLPASLCIIGGGVIGSEFASIYAAFGVRVAVVELMPQLLPSADGEVARRLLAAFRRRGIEVHTSASVTGIRQDPGGLLAVDWRPVESAPAAPGGSVAGGPGSAAGSAAAGRAPAAGASPAAGGTVMADCVLVAVGRRPRTADLGLETAGVTLTRGAVAVDDRLRTSAPGVFALGDAIGGQMLAHAAFAQAEAAADVLAGGSARWGGRVVPNPVFCDPEVAWVGLTEAEAAAGGRPVAVGRFPFAASGRAQIAGGPDGFCKVVAADGGGPVLGVHLIGLQATELVAEGTLAVQAGLPAAALAETIHSHPTLSEVLTEAAGALLGHPLHIARGRG